MHRTINDHEGDGIIIRTMCDQNKIGLLRWDLDKHCASKINKQTKKQNLICTKSVFRWLVKSIGSCAFELLFCPVKSCPCFSQPHPPHPGVESLTWLFHFVIPQLNLLRSPELTPLRSPLNSPVSPLSRLLRLELLCAADTLLELSKVKSVTEL